MLGGDFEGGIEEGVQLDWYGTLGWGLDFDTGGAVELVGFEYCRLADVDGVANTGVGEFLGQVGVDEWLDREGFVEVTSAWLAIVWVVMNLLVFAPEAGICCVLC